MADKTKAQNLPGIPTGTNSSKGKAPKGTPPLNPPPKNKQEKAERKAKKRAERNAFLKARDDANKMLCEAICAMNGFEYEVPTVVVNTPKVVVPINDPTITPDAPAADVPVTIPAEEAPVEEPPVPDASGATTANDNEDDIKVDPVLVAESEAADAAKAAKLNDPKNNWRKNKKLRRMEGKLSLPRNTEDTAFVAAPTEVENVPEVSPELPAPTGDALKDFANTIEHIANGVTAAAEAERPCDTETPTEAPAEKPKEGEYPEQTPAEEAPNNAPVETPAPQPSKPTLVVDNKTRSEFTEEQTAAAKAFYGDAFTSERAAKLTAALKWLNKAIDFEREGSKAKVEMAMKAALKNEAEAFGAAMAMAA